MGNSGGLSLKRQEILLPNTSSTRPWLPFIKYTAGWGVAEWVVRFHLHHCTCQSVSATNQNANMTAESPSHAMISPTVMGSNPSDDDREMEFSVRHCSKTEIFTCINSFIHATTLWNRYYYYSHFKDKESKGYIMSIRTRVFWLWRLLPYLFKLFILAKLNDISIYNRNRRSAALHYAKLPQWILDWQNSWTVYNTVVLLP